MSFAVDLNLLVYAVAEASPFHAAARAFLDRCVEEPETMCLSWPVLMGFLRLTTHPRIVSPPLAPERALENVSSLVGLPHVRVLAEADGFLEVYRETTAGISVRGNLVADAHYAALLRQHGVRRLYSNDTDFRKFRFLDVRNPLEAGSAAR